MLLVLAAALALLSAPTAGALVQDLSAPPAQDPSGSGLLGGADDGPDAVPAVPDAPDGAGDVADDVKRQLNDPAGAVMPAVAIGHVLLKGGDDDAAAPYVCGTAKDKPGEARACGPDHAEDVQLASDRFDVTVTLTNPQAQPMPRAVTVVLLEDGEEIARETVVMEVKTVSYQLYKYQEACDCYLPSRVVTQVVQDWVVDLDLGQGLKGHDYEVVATSGPSSDSSGSFAVNPAKTAAAGPAPSAGFGPAASGAQGLLLAALSGSIAMAGAAAWVLKRR